MSTEAVIIALSFIMATAIVYATVKLAHHSQFLDIPNIRSLHHTPTPNCGGIGIVITFLTAILLLHRFCYTSDFMLLPLLIGGGLIAGIGVLDDFKPIRIRYRLPFHFIASGLLLFFSKGMPALDIGFTIWHWELLGLVVGLLGLVWLINFYNFMDGVDGLAASEAIFVSLAVALLLCLKGSYALIPICLTLAAIVAGYLIWNWPPARIFMGDGGSGFLGFVFGWLLIMTLVQSLLTPWQWLILLACFWVDATTTLIWRFIRGEAWYQPHCEHAFQYVAKKTRSHKQVLKNTAFVNIFWLLPNAILSIYYPKWVLLITFVAVMPLILLCAFLKTGYKTQPTYNLLDTVAD